jgi:hypothetical protein
MDEVREAELNLGECRSRTTMLLREQRATRKTFQEALETFQSYGRRSTEDVLRAHLDQQHVDRMNGVTPRQSDARPDLMCPLDQARFFGRRQNTAHSGDQGRRGAYPASQKGRRING